MGLIPHYPGSDYAADGRVLLPGYPWQLHGIFPDRRQCSGAARPARATTGLICPPQNVDRTSEQVGQAVQPVMRTTAEAGGSDGGTVGPEDLAMLEPANWPTSSG